MHDISDLYRRVMNELSIPNSCLGIRSWLGKKFVPPIEAPLELSGADKLLPELIDIRDVRKVGVFEHVELEVEASWPPRVHVEDSLNLVGHGVALPCIRDHVHRPICLEQGSGD